MSEDRRRCRFWPCCAIHLGAPRLLVDVPEDEREEIRRERATGVPVAALIRAHQLTDQQVRRITQVR